MNSRQYAVILEEITKDAEIEELDKILRSFAELLQSNFHFYLADKIIEEFENIKKEKQEKIKVISASPLPDLLRKKLGQYGELEESVNPDIIGGLVIKTKDTLIDGSLKTKLENVKLKLKQNV